VGTREWHGWRLGTYTVFPGWRSPSKSSTVAENETHSELIPVCLILMKMTVTARATVSCFEIQCAMVKREF